LLYDQDQNLLYVSDINGAPDAKDGNGFISRISMDGKITDRYWTKGLDAPKGMGLANGKLYVADIDKVREIDVKTGKLTHTYPITGAKFLNDISTDNGGKVYISDTNGGAIYVLENGKISQWMKDLKGPNGLLAEEGRMMTALWDAKNLSSIDLTGKQVTLKTDSIENPDGVEAIGDGAYLVSSWNGMVHYVDANGKKTMILDTRPDSLSAADI
jgi:outer membrane protein assembly factor BamB